MKKLGFLIFLVAGCIQTDLEDPFDPSLRIDNTISTIDFRVSGAYALKAIYTDDTGEPSNAEVTWSSSDHSILSFRNNIAEVHSEGLVLITASANGLSATELIETLPSRGSLVISGFVQKMRMGQSIEFDFNHIDINGISFNAIEPNWTSSDESVATVNRDGIVSSIGTGFTDIAINFNELNHVVKVEIVDGAASINPTVHIVSFPSFLTVGEGFQFEAAFFDDNGDKTINGFAWSSDETVLTIDNQGFASAQNPGTATVTAALNGISSSVTVVVEASSEITERTGTLMGTGYDIEGAFSLSEDANGDLILTITGYKPDGPGPYFYLSNINESRRVDGINLGEARTAGDITINVSDIDDSAELITYNFLVIWCEPFGVRLGVGEFDN